MLLELNYLDNAVVVAIKWGKQVAILDVMKQFNHFYFNVSLSCSSAVFKQHQLQLRTLSMLSIILNLLVIQSTHAEFIECDAIM